MSTLSRMLGKKFGRLLVMYFDKVDKNRMAYWGCVCDCGKRISVRGLSLRSGHTKSCGCIRGTHRLSNTRTYYSWVEMRRRCLNKTHYMFPRYGARGISVCKRWENSFDNFLTDMGIRPEGTSLDRVDNKKGYSKKNCRWATSREQIINRSITRWITYKGKKMCLADWAIKTGLPASRISQRIDNWGWSVKDALTQPIMMGVSLSER